MMYIIIGFIILIIGAMLFITQILPKDEQTNNKKQYDINRYYLKNSIVTPVEKWMYNIIQDELTEKYIVAPKVGLKDFIGVKKGNNYMKHFGHIAQRHIDFLVCEKDTLFPALGIEIDDTSHEQKKRKNRDQENDQIYKAIGMKILHIPTQIKEKEFREIIKKEIKPMEKEET